MNQSWHIENYPDTQVVDVSAVARALKIPEGLDPERIILLIQGATFMVETDLDRSLINRQITLNLKQWPCNPYREIRLPKPPYVSVDAVSYIDSNGDLENLTPDEDYTTHLAGDSGKIILSSGLGFPSISNDHSFPITITYTAGYGDIAADIPQAIKNLIVAAVVEEYTFGAVGSELYHRQSKRYKNYFNYHSND